MDEDFKDRDWNDEFDTRRDDIRAGRTQPNQRTEKGNARAFNHEKKRRKRALEKANKQKQGMQKSHINMSFEALLGD